MKKNLTAALVLILILIMTIVFISPPVFAEGDDGVDGTSDTEGGGEGEDPNTEDPNIEDPIIEDPEKIVSNAIVNYYRGEVIKVETITSRQDNTMDEHQVVQYLEVKITSGPFKNRVYSTSNTANTLDASAMIFKLGDKVMLSAEMTESGSDISSIYISDYYRVDLLIAYAIVAAIVICLVGRVSGIRVIVTVVFSCLAYYFYFVPFMLKGVDPKLLILPVALIVTAFNLWMDLGFGKDFLASLVGTAIAAVVAAFLGLIAEKAAHLIGLGGSELEMILYMPEHYAMDFDGLTFALTMMLTVGSAMSVSGAICDHMIETNRSNRYISMNALFAYGMEKGRSALAKSSVGLVFASVVCFVPIWIIYTGYDTPLFVLLNNNIITTQLFRMMASLIGICTCVPVTAYLFAKLLRGRSMYS